jgi:hypothetical protein
MGKGYDKDACSIASVTATAALFGTERFTVHPVVTSVIVRVKQNSPKGLPPLMSDEVDLDKARTSVVPLRPGADRDLGLEQCARLGVRSAMGNEGLSKRCEATVDRR